MQYMRMETLKNNISIYKEGSREKQSVLFVHGFPFDHAIWDEQVSVLRKDYYCASYDVRGLGKSPAGDGQLTMEMLVDDLFDLIDELKLEKPVVCGLSMGGYIALRALEREQEKFGGAVLCDTKSDPDSDEAKLNRANGIKKINNEGARKFCEDFIKNCFAPGSIEKMKEKYTQIVDKAAGFDPIGLKGCLLAMAGRKSTTEFLPRIKISTLFLCGEKDNLTPPDLMKNMSEKINGAKFSVVPGSGHLSSVENHSFVTNEISNFLKTL
jgi:3-oxoadipate enol-lactonase